MIDVLLAVAITFTATATGVEKGTPLEFAFVASGSDRDYEAMFVLDGTADDFCKRIEEAGIPRGCPVDTVSCHLWPVGCELSFDPPLSDFIDVRMPEGLPPPVPVYTGGSRLPSGSCNASTNMPLSVFSLYSLSQSPIVYNGVFEQGVVYGHQLARVQLKKGEKISFTVKADPSKFPHQMSVSVLPGNSTAVLESIRSAAAKSPLSVRVGFSEDLTVAEATAMANALSTIDSVRIKINGYDKLFFRAFLPKVEWLDRQQRLVQPFELSLEDKEVLTYVEEDWSGPGNDPILTPRVISYAETAQHPKTDTCFIYAPSNTKLSHLYACQEKILKHTKIATWYVFSK